MVLILVVFAFLSGVVTILSPCILPILPIVLAGSLEGGKRRPLGVVVGFSGGFTIFTLFLTSLVGKLGISPSEMRNFAVVIVFMLGLSLLLPRIQLVLEGWLTKLSGLTPKFSDKGGFVVGVLIGLSLGLLWTPCVGPILAAVVTLAISGQVTGEAIVVTMAYAFGTALPMLVIIKSGRGFLRKNKWVARHGRRMQRAFGLLMMILALGIYFNLDREFQAWFLDKFPGYGEVITGFENNAGVRKYIDKLRAR